ncbi:MAG TPA: hypothetical protein VIM04_03630 [Candidatus Binatia bacterium]
MNNFENSIALPRMWLAPNYKDPALEAAHREIERLQRVIVLHQLLLDEATSRIGELAKYQHKAGIVIARLYATVRVQRKRKQQERHPTKNAGLSILDVRGGHPGLKHSGLAPSNQGVNRWQALDYSHGPSVPSNYSSRVGARRA